MSDAASDPAPEPEDIVYATHDGVTLLARIYRPARRPDAPPGPVPAVLEVHGGAWIGGDRLNNVAIATALAAAGVLVVSVDFRLPPLARYPVPVADVNHAIRWLKSQAERFGSRADLVGALGTSSGGHLLLLNLLRPHDPRYAALTLAGDAAAGAPDATVAFAVVCWPVADPPTRYRTMQARGNQRLVAAHDQFWPSVEAMEEGSPQAILQSGEDVVTATPLLVMQGTADDNLTPDMAGRLADAYRAAGGAATLRMWPDMPHAFIAADPAAPAAIDALAGIIAFVREHAAIPTRPAAPPRQAARDALIAHPDGVDGPAEMDKGETGTP